MKLTKVTWMLEWYSDTVNGVEHAVREAKKQVKEWSEDAEKWTRLDAMITGGLTELKNDHEIVERLKKFFNQDNVLTKSEYKQKILEGDKDVHKYEDCPDPYKCDIHIGIGGTP